MTHTAADVGRLINKTENWVKRNAAHLPHSRAGRTYFWTDEDLAELLAFLKVRPATPDRPPTEIDDRSIYDLKPLPLGRRARREALANRRSDR